MKLLQVFAALTALAILPACADAGAAEDDPYETYVKTSKDFKSVKQDKDWLLKAFPSWTFMPWYFQWTIGFDDAAGEFCKATGFNGGFTDRGDTAHLKWFEKFKLRFYMDHTAGKGDLHLGDNPKPYLDALHGAGMRVKPVNAAMQARLEKLIKQHIDAVKDSPMRGAYALDDEISWGHFIHPSMWQITDDKTAYPKWLKEIYGPNAPQRLKWVTYNDIFPKLSQWDAASFDVSALLDQWTFNDSYWNNFIGDLVEYANSVDPATPCGYVGGQAPNAFGGFDYAKLMRKVQYLEAYNAGGSQAIVRSFNPHNAMPSVTSYFHRSPEDAAWQVWYYLAQGNRGHIGWVEKWFNDDKTPKDWLAALAPTYLEAGKKIGPLVSGAEWKHDGVALYYSHASIQLGWIMDAQAHGKTWINRNGDDNLGASHLVRKAWTDMLRDEGTQFNWINYAEVIQHGVPKEYKVLILPAALCLSDAEARQLKIFCENGGTLIADYLPGLWDQHGKPRNGGALDELFGVKHDMQMRSKDVFNGSKLWCEVDQDANFSRKSFNAFMSNKNTCIKDASGFNKAVRGMDTVHVNKIGKGSAVLMNLSPQWYNAYRESGGAKDCAKRAVFMQPIQAAGVQRWVRIKDADEKAFGYEITYWTQGTRTILFVVANHAVAVTQTGGGDAIGLNSSVLPITLEFSREIKNVSDERSGKPLGSGKEFKLDWKMNEACVLSFDGN